MRDRVAQAVKAGPLQAGTAVAVATEHAICRHTPTLALGMGTQAIELLVSRLRLGLALGRYPGVNGCVRCSSLERARQRSGIGDARTRGQHSQELLVAWSHCCSAAGWPTGTAPRSSAVA